MAAGGAGVPGGPRCAARRRDCPRARLHGRVVWAGLPGPRRHPGPPSRRGAPPVTGGLVIDDRLLDDPAGLAAADPAGMLLACASSGAQVRASLRTAQDVGVRSLAEDGRPRAVVVAGLGGSG